MADQEARRKKRRARALGSRVARSAKTLDTGLVFSPPPPCFIKKVKLLTPNDGEADSVALSVVPTIAPAQPVDGGGPLRVLEGKLYSSLPFEGTGPGQSRKRKPLYVSKVNREQRSCVTSKWRETVCAEGRGC